MGELVPFPSKSLPTERSPRRLWRAAVGEEFRASRSVRGERIVDVAGRAGVSPQYLSEVERGLKDPSSEVIEAVSGALGLGVDELVLRAVRRLGSASARTDPTCLAA